MDIEEIRRTYDELGRLTVWGALERTTARLPDKTAVVDGTRRMTFSEALRESECLAAGVAELGLGKGDVAAVYMKSSAELVTVFYALQRLGVVVAWLNPVYRELEARFILENSGARALFLFEEWLGYDYLRAVESLRTGLPELDTVVFVAGPEGSASREGTLTLEELSRRGARRPKNEPAALEPEDLSMLLYTSGTTGKPKGAMISQSQALRGGWSYAQGVDATEDDVFLAFLPMSHSFGCGVTLIEPILLGSTMVILERFSPPAAFELIERERCTLQPGAPAHFLMEVNHPKRKEYDLSSLRGGVTGGQIAPEGLMARVEHELGAYLTSVLGASEVGPGISTVLPFGSPLEVREKYVGFPLEGTRVKVVDPVSGAVQRPGEPGELLLSGWHVLQGYWKNPQETARQIRDGWLYTGDLVAQDENGCIRILGRLKECINRGGFKVIPSEIEALLLTHPAVEEACVVGTPNPVLGESVCACLRLRKGGDAVGLEEIRAFLGGKIAPFKLPDELFVLEEFPRLSGGVKLNRFGKGGVAELARVATNKESLRR